MWKWYNHVGACNSWRGCSVVCGARCVILRQHCGKAAWSCDEATHKTDPSTGVLWGRPHRPNESNKRKPSRMRRGPEDISKANELTFHARESNIQLTQRRVQIPSLGNNKAASAMCCLTLTQSHLFKHLLCDWSGWILLLPVWNLWLQDAFSS